MKFCASRVSLLAVALAVVLGCLPASAQLHRATRLGNPATRFAPPLFSPDDLRARFRDEKLRPDFIAVLDQWGWTGDPTDMFRAALTNEITEVSIKVGERMPFMSTREKGKPICLRDVLWAGKEPAPAYAFNFTSKGRRYRCVTPKACSNFFLEDQGAPALTLQCDAPAEMPAGRPVKVCFTLRNTGNAAEGKIAVTLPAPAGAEFVSESQGNLPSTQKLMWEFPELAPGQAKLICASFILRQPGPMRFAMSANGELSSAAQSNCETKVVGIPAILLEVVDVEDPIEVGKEVTYEIKVTNQGSAPGTNIRLDCTPPASQEFVSGTGTTSMSATNGVITMESLSTLDPKAAACWRVVVKAAQAADARFKVELRSDQFAQPIQEDEATQQY